MSEQRPYFPFYPKDWLGSASVSSMPLAAQGLYARLLAFAWLSDGLPADDEALRRLAGVERAEWRRVWPLVSSLWEARDGRLYQAKQERVRQEQTAYTEAKRKAGQKGGATRAARAAEGKQAPSNEVSKTQADDQAEPKPSSASASAKKKNPPTPKGEYPPDFERFWSAYPNGTDPENPRRAGKAKAFKAWQKLDPDEAFIETLLAALAWQRNTLGWTKEGGQFIPLPATWLNGRRWEDERPAGLDLDTDEEPLDPRYDLTQPYEPQTRPIEGW